MKTRPVRTELFQAERTDTTKLIDAVHSFANPPKKGLTNNKQY